MAGPVVVVLTGFSCTGKTTFGRAIAKNLKVPFLSRDELKEILFDCLGYSTREWSKKLGEASYELFYHELEQLLMTGKSLVVETNLKPENKTKFEKAIRKHPHRLVHFDLYAEMETLLRRFERRHQFGERHPGHVDHATHAGYKKAYPKGAESPRLRLGKTTHSIDTGDFKMVKLGEFLKRIKQL